MKREPTASVRCVCSDLQNLECLFDVHVSAGASEGFSPAAQAAEWGGEKAGTVIAFENGGTFYSKFCHFAWVNWLHGE
jgi:hypothetical protein